MLCASGMGLTTYTSARILKGQLQNQTGEETVMTMDTFPNVGLVKVKLKRSHKTRKMLMLTSEQTNENQYCVRFFERIRR